MKEGRKPEYPEKTPGDELQKICLYALFHLYMHAHIDTQTYSCPHAIKERFFPGNTDKIKREICCFKRGVLQSWWLTKCWSSYLSDTKAFLLSAFFFFFFFLCVFPSYISGVHHFWVRFLRMWPFFNPTIKVVTFRLRGWCVLGVFLLPAFTRLGHERQDLLSPCDEMHVYTD